MSLFKETDAEKKKKEAEAKKKKQQNVVNLPETHTPNSKYKKNGNQGNTTNENEVKEGEQNHVVDALHSNVNNEEASIADILNSIAEPEPEEEKPKQVSIYLEPAVKEAFVAFGKAKGKGKRSELVNKLLKQALKEYLPTK